MAKSRRVTMAAAAAALGVDVRSVRRWRPLAPRGMFTKGRGRSVLVDPEELGAWARANGYGGKGRPADVDALLRGGASAPMAAAPRGGRDPSPPAAESPQPASRGAASSPFSAEDRAALQEALGIGEEEVARLLGLPDRVIRHVSADARARKERADAEARELANACRRAELVPLEEVRRFWHGQIDLVKAHFLALPGKLAGQLAERPYDEVHELLDRELHELLEAFAQEIPLG